MINIVCALHCEAKPIIEYYKLSALADSVFPVFVNKQINLLVSGIGRVSTAGAMAYLFAKTQEQKNNVWLNYGIAGHKSATIGTWFNVNKITESATEVNWYPSRFQTLHCLTAPLETVDCPQSHYYSDALYDMEASAFMAIALKFSSIELIQVMKVISDNEENHLEKIDKKYVQNLLQDNISPLIEMIEILQKKQEEFNAIYGLDKLFQDCLEKWHFTQYQKKEVERLIQRWHILGNKSNISQLALCRDAKQVVLWFKSELEKTSVEY